MKRWVVIFMAVTAITTIAANRQSLSTLFQTGAIASANNVSANNAPVNNVSINNVPRTINNPKPDTIGSNRSARPIQELRQGINQGDNLTPSSADNTQAVPSDALPNEGHALSLQPPSTTNNDVFSPSEEVSEDLSISFPTDI